MSDCHAMSTDDRPEEQWADGTWHVSIPLPLWVGWRLRVAQCCCGSKFHGRDALAKYRAHWFAAQPEPGTSETPQGESK